ncbi:ATP-binding protein [Streptosporangium sp. NPDC087985]|uniref:ATP-binding protein n=1 Tax=Streptosporangium sp. NPDC087985 TaxID=3366196 RepID=UPI00381AF5FE
MLLPDTVTVPNTRKRVRHQLADWGVSEHGDDVELLVTELVTNAVRHSRAAVITISMNDDALRCEVQDTNTNLPQVRHALDVDEGGRGLYLVEALAHSWGSHRTPTGKIVWFEMARTAETATSMAGNG